MEYETGSRPLETFCTDLAAKQVTPAGGTAGAAVAAIGTALCEMVCLHLDSADVTTDAGLAEHQGALQNQRATLFALADADAAVVDELFGTDGRPDPETRKRAVRVPLAVAEACETVLEIAIVVTETADRPVVADAGTGAFLVHAALQNAVFTVRRNLGTIDDTSFVTETEQRAADLKAAGDRAFEATLANVGTDE